MKTTSRLALALPLFLLASCFGDNQGNNGDNQGQTNAGNKTQPKADYGEATVYVATSAGSQATDMKTIVYKNGRTLYSFDGNIDWLGCAGGHLYFTLETAENEDQNVLYIDGTKTSHVFGPDAWIFMGSKDVFFDDFDGKLVDADGKVVHSYTLDEDGSSTINEVLEKDGQLFISAGNPTKIYKNGDLIFNDEKSNIYPENLIYDNGSLYFCGTGSWEGEDSALVIYKDNKIVLGGLSTEGTFFVNNGDIYTTDFTKDSADNKSVIVKNGKESFTVNGGLENLEMDFYNGKSYAWSFDYGTDGSMKVSISENFKDKATLSLKPQNPNKRVFCTEYLFFKGDIYMAVVDFSTPGTVSLYRNAELLQNFTARTYEDDAFPSADFEFDVQ